MKTLAIIFYISISLLILACSKDSFTDVVHDENENSYALTGITTKKATKFKNLFNRYGNGWTGGDATYSVALPDGRTIWMFGDSFLDTVYADYSRPASELVRNCFVVQHGAILNTLVSNTIDDPQPLVNTPEPFDEWYWPGDATVQGDTLYTFMFYFIRTGGGIFDFEYIRTDLITFSLPSITEVTRTTISTDPDLMFGAAVYEDADYTYIYSSETAAFTKYLHVARVPAGNIRGTFEYWNGDTWVTTPPPSDVGRLERPGGLSIDVSSQFAVFYWNDKYRLVTQEGFLGPTIFSWESTSPTGPWSTKQTLYVTPETSGDIFTYNAFVHPQFVSGDGALLMSYNVNSMNFFDLFDDARIYRPRFVWFKYM